MATVSAMTTSARSSSADEICSRKSCRMGPSPSSAFAKSLLMVGIHHLSPGCSGGQPRGHLAAWRYRPDGLEPKHWRELLRGTSQPCCAVMTTRLGIELSPTACRIVEVKAGLAWRRHASDTRVRSFAVVPRSGPETRAKLESLRRQHAAVVVWHAPSEHRQVV